MKFYGEYQAATTSQTGCTKRFLSTDMDKVLFPPHLEYRCDLCAKIHGFRLIRSHQVSTPKQMDRIETYCQEQGIEKNIEINT